jgi:hypothetical protein
MAQGTKKNEAIGRRCSNRPRGEQSGNLFIFNALFVNHGPSSSWSATNPESPLVARASFAASQGDAFHEKSLKEQEHDNDRQNDQAGGRHQKVKLDPVHRLEKRQPQRQGI